jgi:hypothetical protein
MSSNSKNKTTMAKRARESRLRERRIEKQERKDSRRQAAADHQPTAIVNSYDAAREAADPDALTGNPG